MRGVCVCRVKPGLCWDGCGCAVAKCSNRVQLDADLAEEERTAPRLRGRGRKRKLSVSEVGVENEGGDSGGGGVTRASPLHDLDGVVFAREKAMHALCLRPCAVRCVQLCVGMGRDGSLDGWSTVRLGTRETGLCGAGRSLTSVLALCPHSLAVVCPHSLAVVSILRD
jgi:hypothetical protein